ncbi:uncharacterized protein LOC130678059 isoform X2 [Microplitis mediator]|uniref:uncharacterized protein LOC130678059 isoform X2 n=1 Tax=Microplitis mediator TaxID=375433 RepID=UPI002554203F|nr:uncharacterized protein LOC130678059 isoform X2 [Microplitis mediator]
MIKCVNVKAALINFLFIATFTNPLSLNKYRVVNNDNGQNVGSVLFDKSDLKRKCWNNEQLTLLISRHVFQDVLPEVEMIDPENNEYIGLIMEYMDVCLEVIRKLATDRTRHLMMRALADTMAGYLHVYILPVTKKSYYAGNIQYHDAKKLFDLYDELKVFLHSNGIGWVKPKNNEIKFKGDPVSTEADSQACSNLILYPDDKGTVVLPMPFLDDNKNPNSIALPFENESLYSLYTESSAFILLKYYEVGYSCMSSSREKRGGVTKGNINKFVKQLEDWLNHAVIGHLEDDKWYPAFGGILRVIRSLEMSKTDPSRIEDEEDDNPIVGAINPSSTCAPNESNKSVWDKWGYILIPLIIGVPFWLLLGICVVCCRRKQYVSYRCGAPVAVVYKNAKCINQENVSSGRGARYFTWPWNKKKSDLNCPCSSKNCIDKEAEVEKEEKFIGEMEYGNYVTQEINERNNNIDSIPIARPTAKSAPIKYPDTDSVMSTTERSNFSDNSKSSPS